MSHSQLSHYRLSHFLQSKKDGKDHETIQSSTNLTQDTTWESNKNTINITNMSQEVSPFPAGDHKAAMNKSESMRAFPLQTVSHFLQLSHYRLVSFFTTFPLQTESHFTTFPLQTCLILQLPNYRLNLILQLSHYRLCLSYQACPCLQDQGRQI